MNKNLEKMRFHGALLVGADTNTVQFEEFFQKFKGYQSKLYEEYKLSKGSKQHYYWNDFLKDAAEK